MKSLFLFHFNAFGSFEALMSDYIHCFNFERTELNEAYNNNKQQQLTSANFFMAGSEDGVTGRSSETLHRRDL